MRNGLRSTLDASYSEIISNFKGLNTAFKDVDAVKLNIENAIACETVPDDLNEIDTNENSKIDIKDNGCLLLGLDYGVKKMGMAMGNTLSQNARPFDILVMNNGQPADWDNLIGIIVTWKINEIIVGHPINMDGSDSMLAKRAHKFARRLAHRLIELKLPISVKLFDERLTSIEARTLAWEHGLIKHERDPIDDISACLVLASYLANPNHAHEIANYDSLNH